MSTSPRDRRPPSVFSTTPDAGRPVDESTSTEPGRRRSDGPTTREEWEQVRRSVAMLPPGAWAMTREEALRALQSLVRCLGR